MIRALNSSYKYRNKPIRCYRTDLGGIELRCYDPITGAIAVGLVGTALSTVSSISQGETQAAILRQNANIARMQGTMTNQTEKAKQLDLSEQRRKMIGAQVAKYGGAGVDPGVGTPLDVMADTYKNYERDIQYAGYTGQVSLVTGQAQASADDWAANNAATSGFIKAGSTLLSGISQPFLSGPGASLLKGS